MNKTPRCVEVVSAWALTWNVLNYFAIALHGGIGIRWRERRGKGKMSSCRVDDVIVGNACFAGGDFCIDESCGGLLQL